VKLTITPMAAAPGAVLRFTAMPDHSLSVVAELKKAVSRAQDARVGSVQRAMHLLCCGFFQNARLDNVGVGVTTVLQVRDHEARHIRHSGVHCADRKELHRTE